jgi:hypothetical protein
MLSNRIPNLLIALSTWADFVWLIVDAEESHNVSKTNLQKDEQ